MRNGMETTPMGNAVKDLKATQIDEYKPEAPASAFIDGSKTRHALAGASGLYFWNQTMDTSRKVADVCFNVAAEPLEWFECLGLPSVFRRQNISCHDQHVITAG